MFDVQVIIEVSQLFKWCLYKIHPTYARSQHIQDMENTSIDLTFIIRSMN
jgi:hypothetical protein